MMFNGKTVVTLDNLKIGAIVTRGPDWTHDNQDGGFNGEIVGSLAGTWITVIWHNSYKNNYRIGDLDNFGEPKYDLCYVDSMYDDLFIELSDKLDKLVEKYE